MYKPIKILTHGTTESYTGGCVDSKVVSVTSGKSKDLCTHSYLLLDPNGKQHWEISKTFYIGQDGERTSVWGEVDYSDDLDELIEKGYTPVYDNSGEWVKKVEYSEISSTLSTKQVVVQLQH